jgi:hypothetical protein
MVYAVKRRVFMNKNKKVSSIIGVLLVLSVALSALALIVCPLIWNLEDKDIFTFLGQFTGSVVSVLATLYAFHYTIKQNEEENALTRTQMEYQIRLPILPVIGIDKVSYSENVGKYIFLSNKGLVDQDLMYSHYLFISISNIGSGTATDIELSTNNGRRVTLGNIAVGSNKIIGVCLPSMDRDSKEEFCVNLEIGFHDIQYRTYYQPFSIKLENNNYKTECETYPRLITAQ